MLESVIAGQPEQLQELFTAPDGLTAKIKNGIGNSFTGNANLLDSVESGFDSRIERTQNRIDREERFL